MHSRLAASAFTVVAVLGLVAGCKSTDATGSSTATTNASNSNGEKSGASAAVPDFLGMGLQSAQDKAQAAGFYELDSHDSLGRARHQILDRDWKVCSQKPVAGTKTSTDTRLDFGAVKTGETCPAHDQAAPSAAGRVMPDFSGKSVSAARDALAPDTSLDVIDGSGQGRMVLIESNWKVCTQKPAAGAKLSGQPVALTAVKFEESCP
ncbi:hypothetical protein [Streptomyces sp. NPDC004579]|uniref:hypothetical protein n=1 Tax=Streptomyces sp. NPDC004579 TaxID=3154667 RepID=UPI0033BC23BF